MGLFSKKKKKTPPKPTPAPSSNTGSSVPEKVPEKAKLEFAFDCRLAHGGPTRTIRNFRNIKELYQQMASALEININNILFVTVNTEKCDMTKLLGGQIMFGDFLYVHLSTPSTTVIEVEKTSQMFGLTITDNGNGQAFVKGKRTGSILENVDSILAGDAILSINGDAMIGKKHIDVAKKLRSIPLGTMVQFVLQPPVRGMNQINSRTGKKVTGDPNKPGMTVRIKSNGEAEVVPSDNQYKSKAVDILDNMMEEYVGIRDRDLCKLIYDCGCEAPDSSFFNSQILQEYPMFSFSDEFILEAWAIISDAQAGVMPDQKRN